MIAEANKNSLSKFNFYYIKLSEERIPKELF